MTNHDAASAAKILKDLHEQKAIEGRAAGKSSLPPTFNPAPLTSSGKQIVFHALQVNYTIASSVLSIQI
jgi:hypothetical protein